MFAKDYMLLYFIFLPWTTLVLFQLALATEQSNWIRDNHAVWIRDNEPVLEIF